MLPILSLLAVLIVLLLFARNSTARAGQTSNRSRDRLLLVVFGLLICVLGAGGFALLDLSQIPEGMSLKWANIALTALFVFGQIVYKFWDHRKKWPVWAGWGILAVAHCALLSQLHWKPRNYFWMIIVIGLPEIVVVSRLTRAMLRQGNHPASGETADLE